MQLVILPPTTIPSSIRCKIIYSSIYTVGRSYFPTSKYVFPTASLVITITNAALIFPFAHKAHLLHIQNTFLSPTICQQHTVPFFYLVTWKLLHNCNMFLFLNGQLQYIFFFSHVQWATFFSDLLQYAGSGVIFSIELYLRVLMAIDEEVGDRHIIHTHEVRLL